MPFAIRGQVAGLADLKKALAGVDERVRKRALKKGINAATGPILKKARAKVRRRFGILAKSLGRKVKVYKSGAVVGIVGPRGGFRMPIGVRKRGEHAGEVIYEDPRNIAHLVEKGTSHSRAFPFLRPALDESRQESKGAVEDAVLAELRK